MDSLDVEAREQLSYFFQDIHRPVLLYEEHCARIIQRMGRAGLFRLRQAGFHGIAAVAGDVHNYVSPLWFAFWHCDVLPTGLNQVVVTLPILALREVQGNHKTSIKKTRAMQDNPSKSSFGTHNVYFPHLTRLICWHIVTVAQNIGVVNIMLGITKTVTRKIRSFATRFWVLRWAGMVVCSS